MCFTVKCLYRPMFASVVAGFRQGQLCFTVLCLYRPMYIFSSRGILSGSVVSNSLMPLSSDVRLQESRGFFQGQLCFTVLCLYRPMFAFSNRQSFAKDRCA